MPILVAAIIAFMASTGRAADEIKVGEMLDQATAQKAEGLLPPEILRHYRDVAYANRIVEWSQSKADWPSDFQAAIKANEGRFTIGKDGEILDQSTGRQPPYIFGHPFPTIDTSDSNAGVKILWNHFYRTWWFGNLHAESQVNWINTTALERRTDQDVRFLYYDGLPENERLPNPQNFLTQQLIVVVSPADLHGTAALTWRYRDADKRDSTWTFVPALRRVRAVSPANRSDGFLGSDMAQDDGPFFDGKPEDFTWVYKGEADELRLADELSLKGQAKAIYSDSKGWSVEWPDAKFLGYMDPAWKGVAWAPATGVLAKRRFYIVEGTPKDRYYLYGKLELHIDKTTFQGSWNRKFNWKGEALATMQVMAYQALPFTRPDGKIEYNQGSNQAFQCAENLKLNRATVAGIKSSPTSGFYVRTKFEPGLFDVDALSRYGK